jgi:hypothetical protein
MHRREIRTRIIAQTLPLEHAREAGRCAQFPRQGTLASRPFSLTTTRAEGVTVIDAPEF